MKKIELEQQKNPNQIIFLVFTVQRSEMISGLAIYMSDFSSTTIFPLFFKSSELRSDYIGVAKLKWIEIKDISF
jgi:hypothetical protein